MSSKLHKFFLLFSNIDMALERTKDHVQNKQGKQVFLAAGWKQIDTGSSSSDQQEQRSDY